MHKASPLTAELQEQIDKLGPEEKKYLLRSLIADLDGSSHASTDESSEEISDAYSAEEISAAWLQEAQRRCKELEDGTAIAIPAEEAIAKARERLRHVRRTSS